MVPIENRYLRTIAGFRRFWNNLLMASNFKAEATSMMNLMFPEKQITLQVIGAEGRTNQIIITLLKETEIYFLGVSSGSGPGYEWVIALGRLPPCERRNY